MTLLHVVYPSSSPSSGVDDNIFLFVKQIRVSDILVITFTLLREHGRQFTTDPLFSLASHYVRPFGPFW